MAAEGFKRKLNAILSADVIACNHLGDAEVEEMILFSHNGFFLEN